MLKVVVDNLRHPAAGIRRASIKTVQKLRVVSNEVFQEIVSCLVSGSQDLQKDALKALEELLGKRLSCLYHAPSTRGGGGVGWGSGFNTLASDC